MPTSKVPVVAVVGTTASGKSALAMSLAKRFTGELVCADSRTIYRGLDIGSAKPSPEDRAAVPHHLLDELDVGDALLYPDFTRRVERAIVRISARKHLPIVVGGSKLCLEAALFDLTCAPQTDASFITDLPLDVVHDRFQSSGVALPLLWRDRQTLADVWASNRIAQRGEARRPTLILSTTPISWGSLVSRVRMRAREMLSAGLEAEVRSLCATYGLRARDLCSIGYEEWDAHFEGSVGAEAVYHDIVVNTLAYAQGQLKWLPQLRGAHRVAHLRKAEAIVADFLAANDA